MYRVPLAEIVFGFFDQLKSRTRGYASLDYEVDGYTVADLVRVDILLNGLSVDAFSAIVHKDKAYAYGRKLVDRLRVDSSPTVRCADSGRHRFAHHRPRDRKRPSARTFSPSATAETSLVSASCSKSRKRGSAA